MAKQNGGLLEPDMLAALERVVRRPQSLVFLDVH